ncbi:MAG: CHAT domain-containing protein [candidate division KSB1 bacterium]|nr:CHAT domain-containing protein [candidate division KSB1 bacterium]
MSNEKRFALFNRRRLLYIALGLGLIGLLIFSLQPDSALHRIVNTRRIPPDSIKAYLLKPADRQMLVVWGNLRRSVSLDCFQHWARQHHWPLQNIGLRLLEQATLFHEGGKTQLAVTLSDTARELGQTLAEVLQDSFLLRHAEHIQKLSTDQLQLRARACQAWADAYDLIHARKYVPAADKCNRAMRLAEQAGDDKLVIDAMSLSQYLSAIQNEYQSAIALGKKILERAECAGYRRRVAITLWQTALSYNELAQDSSALAAAIQAGQIAGSMSDSEMVANSLYTQAQIYFDMGAHQQAEDVLQKLFEIDTDRRYGGRATLLLGQIYYLRGEYTRAQIQFEQALTAFRGERDTMSEAVTLGSLSILKTLTGEYEIAATLEEKALALKKTQDDWHKIAVSMSNLGYIYLKLDSLDKAIATLERALSFFGSASDRHAINAWLILGDAQLKRGNFSAAQTVLAKVESVATAINLKLTNVEAKIGLGHVFLGKGQPERARSYFLRALEMAHQINEPSLVAHALFGQAQAEQRLQHLDHAAELLEQAITQAEKLRSKIVPDTTRTDYFATVQDYFDLAISLALARGRNDLALFYAERAKARALRDAFAAAGTHDLQESQLARLNVAVPNFPILQQTIPASVQVVEYRLTPDTLLIWLIDRHQLVTRRVAVSSYILAQRIQEFLQSLGAVDLETFRARADHDLKAVYEENCQLGRELYQLIWAPIAAAIVPGKTLCLIPDGILHRLPFGALVAEEGWFFDEHYVWAKAPSLSILVENSDWHLPLVTSKQARFLMVASDLPSTNVQRRLLSRLFVNANFLVKQDATYAALQERLRDGANLVYFSVHAVADERHPMNSYLELYTDDMTGNSRDKTEVYARQLLALELAKTSLVILNACETSNGKITRGEGVLNLVRIFGLAKVPVVVASLWKNDDRFSALITGDFFRKIAEHQEYAFALHQAKMLAMQKLRNDYGLALPYFWAVFEVYQNVWSQKLHS